MQINIKVMIIIRNREKYFSSSEEYNSYLEERRYNIVSDLYHSGLKRAYQKNVGRLRSKVADSLSKKAVKQTDNKFSAFFKYTYDPRVKDEKVKKGVIKSAIKDGDTRISRFKIGEEVPFASDNETIKSHFKDSLKREKYKLDNKRRDYWKTKISLDKGKYNHQVFVPKGNGVEDLAHELGHVENNKSKGLRKLIYKTANAPGNRQSLWEDYDMLYNGNHGKSGFKTALKDYGKSLLINQEERNANKAGIRLMEQSGASKEELKKAKKRYDSGVKNYIYAGRANLFNTLKNTVQIPSRKFEPISINNEEARKKARKLKIKYKQ